MSIRKNSAPLDKPMGVSEMNNQPEPIGEILSRQLTNLPGPNCEIDHPLQCPYCGFDYVHLKCIDPETIGMRMNENGFWRKPMSEEVKAQKNALKAV